jgi:hypothetical protein
MKCEDLVVELGGLEPPTPCLQTEPAPPADQAEL